VTTNQHISTGQAHEIDLVALLRVLVSHKRIVGITTVLCLAVAIYLRSRVSRSFEPTCALLSVSGAGCRRRLVLAGEPVQTGFGEPCGVDLGDSDQQRQRRAILESRRLVEEFVKRDDVWRCWCGSEAKPTLWLVVQNFAETS